MWGVTKKVQGNKASFQAFQEKLSTVNHTWLKTDSLIQQHMTVPQKPKLHH